MEEHHYTIPFAMKAVLLYLAFASAIQTTKLAKFITAANPAEAIADLIGFATIVVPLALFSGIIDRKRWARILAILWLGVQLMFTISITVVAFLWRNIFPVTITTVTEFSVEVFCLVYLYRTTEFFDAPLFPQNH